MNFHLTKAEVAYDTAAKAGLRDSYAWHRRIWEAFPGVPEARRDFLTRIDERDDHLRLLLLSPGIPVRPPWCPVDRWQTKAISEAFLGHPRYRFSLVANAIKRERSSRKRVTVTGLESLSAWAHRKAAANGFAIDPDSLKILPRTRQAFIKDGKAGLHAATEFQGELEVLDRDGFVHAFAHGIGPAKAFGFGMLCLAPL